MSKGCFPLFFFASTCLAIRAGPATGHKSRQLRQVNWYEAYSYPVFCGNRMRNAAGQIAGAESGNRHCCKAMHPCLCVYAVEISKILLSNMSNKSTDQRLSPVYKMNVKYCFQHHYNLRWTTILDLPVVSSSHEFVGDLIRKKRFMFPNNKTSSSHTSKVRPMNSFFLRGVYGFAESRVISV